ncbi:phytoene desaturase [Natronobacillus azotifigens]|uniref:4,4'-diaponeurosporene oxygenase n=1 Tax=Natronobacillus azotifigens TaxID=472978 RepID=A0A9J6R8D5_9BACI|nr:phytoene desaturase family protein [Natronobacillus azotifigens]MCZ0701922.1 phytoene desaturase family protein [Natronobacillus azotifigens]
MKDIVIVGGGLGGLSAAIRLQHAGYHVRVLEKEATIGGKLQSVTMGDYQFDLGPSTFTLKHVFEDVFTSVGKDPNDYLTFYPIEEGTRNFFPNGQMIDFSTDVQRVQSQIRTYSENDADHYPLFLEEAKRLYRISERQFFSQLMYRTKTKLSPSLLRDFIKIKPFTSLNTLVERYFEHPNTCMLLNRYATYVGSSPYQAPMIFAMMAHLEGGQGIWGVKNGSYQIVRAFEQLARELGVIFHMNHEVREVVQKGKQLIAVHANGKRFEADQVIFNADALTVYNRLLKRHPLNKKLKKKEVSLSGFTLLLGIKKTYPELRHHNVFFPREYTQEFKAIFDEKIVPEEPTIYICQSSVSEPSRAKKEGGNLFILINAPYLSSNVTWNDETKETIKNRVIDQLESHGLTDLSSRIEEEYIMTPEDIHDRTGAFKGSIYGMSSNHLNQAFFRIENKDPVLSNVYFVGGSTHPGGGTPMVTLSGQLVAKDIMDQYGSMKRDI